MKSLLMILFTVITFQVNAQQQKVILITGTASGIGKAAATTMIEKGYTVYGGDIQVEENLYLNEIGGHALIMDVTKDDQINANVQKVMDEQGRIDVLINNAGYGSFSTIENIDMDELQYQFDVNVFGYARLQKAVLPHMRKQRSGLIVEISSVVGEISYPMLGWYAATKHAVEAMADALRQEVAPFGINVVKIQPGAVKTNFPNVALAKLDQSYIPEDYKQLAADFKLVVEGNYAYNAESLDGTVDYIIQAIEADQPETEYRTTLSSRMAIQTKSNMSESDHDKLNANQFQQAVNYLRNIMPAEKKKETLKQPGTSITPDQGEKDPLNLSSTNAVEEVLGDWDGILDISGTQLLIRFHISVLNGNLNSTMDSPNQNANGIPIDETTYENGKLKLVAHALNANYNAELSKEGDTLNGNFEQNGLSWELILTRVEEESQTVVRPQEPKDFPYYREEVRFENPKGGHYLAGTLTMPKDRNFTKVIILISGSGPQDRNEEVLNHRPFLVLSDHFTREGIAVLRYDDRGVAASEGEFTGATSKDFAEDAAAAVAYLKSRIEMKDKAIGLIGHSEGGMIAPMIASENKNVDFIVLLAGPGINIQELLLLQQEKAAEAGGVPAATRETMDKIAKEMFAYIETHINETKDQLRTGLSQLAEKGYEQLSDAAKQQIGNKENFINQQTNMLTSNWYLYLMRFSPDHFLSKVKCPVLAVNGELDMQVTSKENLEGIRNSLKRANNKKVTIHEFIGLNHLFQKTKTGAPSEYGSLEETFNKEAMEYVSQWILALKI